MKYNLVYPTCIITKLNFLNSREKLYINIMNSYKKSDRARKISQIMTTAWLYLSKSHSKTSILEKHNRINEQGIQQNILIIIQNLNDCVDCVIIIAYS